MPAADVCNKTGWIAQQCRNGVNGMQECGERYMRLVLFDAI
jgi:hypothetical protein